MILYLSAQELSVIKIDGKPAFNISDKPKKLEIDSFSPPLLEINKLNGASINFCFYPSCDFFACPPPSVILTKMVNGYHLFIKKDFSLLPFKVITQKKIDGAVITVFCDRGYKISVETLLDYHLQDLDCQIDSAEIFDIDSNQNVFISLSGSEKILCAFNLKEKIKLVFLKNVFSFEISEKLTTIEKFPTHLKHEKKCEWEFIEDNFSLKNFSLRTERQLETDKLNDKILSYAFLEGLFLGENVDKYLCEKLTPYKDKLYSYLGNYVGVFPPEPSICQDYVGLLYKKGENVYQTRYAKVSVENNKVVNVKLLDD